MKYEIESYEDYDELKADIGAQAIEACEAVVAAWEGGDLAAAASQCQSVADDAADLALALEASGIE